MKNQLYCGASKRVVTPPTDMLPDLRGNIGMEFNKVLDDLYLRVIALGSGTKKVLIICFESGYPCCDEIFEQLRRRTGVPQENILLLHTHVHAAPMISGAINNSIGNPRKHINKFYEYPPAVQTATLRYSKFLAAQMYEAVDEAIASMRPARMGHATGSSYINVCRNVSYTASDGSGEKYALGADLSIPIDHSLFAMKFEALDGTPIAFFLNYPVHNCAMVFNRCGEDGKSAISSDISGRACRNLEKAYPGSVALWTSGAAGDIDPILGNEVFYPDPGSGGAVKMPSDGKMADAILELLSAHHYADILRTIRKIDLTVGSMTMQSVVDWSHTPGVDKDNKIVDGLYSVRLQLVRLGDVALVGVSGELYHSYGELIKQLSPMKHTVILNHAASDLAFSEYIYDDDAFRHSPGLVQSPPDAIAPSGLCGGIVGINTSQMVPGYFSDSLKSIIPAMFEEVL